MIFSEFLRYYLAFHKMTASSLRMHLNGCGIKNVKGTLEKWVSGNRTPHVFKQKRIARILGADCLLVDDKIIFIPLANYNRVDSLSSNNLDNSGGAV